jgi:Helix-turn-helix domain
MRCYSHLSDDEREQIGLAKALGHSIGAIAQAIGRPKSTICANSPATGCRAGATRRPDHLVGVAWRRAQPERAVEFAIRQQSRTRGDHRAAKLQLMPISESARALRKSQRHPANSA